MSTELETFEPFESIARLSPGFMDPEGVVVYVAAARKLFKKTLKGDAHKGALDNSAA